jgi:hypothetical protein
MVVFKIVKSDLEIVVEIFHRYPALLVYFLAAGQG